MPSLNQHSGLATAKVTMPPRAVSVSNPQKPATSSHWLMSVVKRFTPTKEPRRVDPIPHGHSGVTLATNGHKVVVEHGKPAVTHAVHSRATISHARHSEAQICAAIRALKQARKGLEEEMQRNRRQLARQVFDLMTILTKPLNKRQWSRTLRELSLDRATARRLLKFHAKTGNASGAL